ncbi:hypothetical protein ACF0H5_010050 [Mactra antiquata]
MKIFNSKITLDEEVLMTITLNEITCCYDNVGKFHTFGDTCYEYMCHCSSSNDICDKVTGQCPNRCADGWTGPGCQFKNVAYNMPADGNDGENVAVVTDGNDDTCSTHNLESNNPFIQVSLRDEIYVTEVVVVFKNYTAAKGFKVYAGTTATRDESTLCYTDTDDVIGDNRVSVLCHDRVSATYITVQVPGETKLEICEIELPVGRHLSYKKDSFASESEKNNAATVNDGTISEFYASKEQSDPYWYVDLGSLYIINMVQIRNREDLKYFILGFQIHLSNSSDFDSEGMLVYTDSSSRSSIRNDIFVPIPSISARYVRVSIPGEKKRLHMREVWVLGGCPENQCGLDCGKMCFCEGNKPQTSTDQIEGRCPGECERNWRNIDGYCNTSLCPGNMFGYQCRYDCKCSDICDPWSGRCLPELSKCERHYFGDSCQGFNVIAESRFTLEGFSSVYGEARATVDGRINSCSVVLSGESPSWFVPVGNERNVDQVLVYVNESNTPFGIDVSAEFGDTSRRCSVNKLGAGQYLARCGNSPTNLVRVSTSDTMQICEVAVLECTNGTYGPLCENACICADRKACDKTTGVCPETGCAAGYRGDRCTQECIPGNYGINCELECGYCNDDSPCDIINGQCSRPCQSGWQGNRCDEECRNGTYGEDCTSTCGKCVDREPCDSVTGVCPNGCDAGFELENCTVECEDGRYGYNCNETCGDCKNNDICAKDDGACVNGCKLGKDPPTCKDDCPHGSYGMNCEKKCGKCANNVTCDLFTGVCKNGCDPGVYVTGAPNMCNTPCPNGLYGYNCSRSCTVGVCKGGDICNKATGACMYGCLTTGYQPPFCTAECYDGTFGLECQHKCGMCEERAPCNKTNGHCPRGCEPEYAGPKCWDKAPHLSGISVAVLVIGCILAVVGLIGLFLGWWIYKKGSWPWASIVKYRKRKHSKYGADAPRNSVISRVYENNITSETEPAKLKRNGSNNGDYIIPESKPRGTIAVEDFWNFVIDKKSSRHEMSQQFKDLAVGLTHPCETAKKAQNLRKNRYKEIFAYDHSRVKLDIIPGDIGNDYINACYISGYNKPHMYIASQGPTEELVNDFWRMIWQKRIRKIVNLTRLVEHNKVKCCQYWPDDGTSQYSNVKVECSSTDTYADFTIRNFIISVEGQEKREVRQYHFEAWPDRNVPEYASSVIDFRSLVKAHDMKDNVPILIHCSAGIGRTGTFIALDYLVDQANIEDYVNVLQCAQNLRHQRVNMIQNQAQYEFLHDALLEAMFCPSEAIPSDKFTAIYQKKLEIDPNSKKSKLALEFERLQYVTKYQESLNPGFYSNGNYKAAKSSQNDEKNRISHILPSDEHRPWLMTRVQDKTDYINAVYLPSYRYDKMFLLTQNPLPDTIVDFWRMIYENKVSTIINLDLITQSSEIYWAKETETVTYIPFTIHHMNETDHVTYIERNQRLQNAEEPREKARFVKILECKFWMNEDRVPVGGESSVLAVYEQVLKWQQNNGNHPIVVHCRNGATKSGLFCAVMSTMERLRQENDVALQQTIKQMRIRRHQIVPTYNS